MNEELQQTRPAAESPRFARKETKRRDFLGLAALWSFIGTGIVMALGALRLPMPSIFPETGSRFRIGRPERFPKGSRTLIPERNVLVLHDEDGLRALSLVCTHLGCIVRQVEGEGFACPCHGSRFDPFGKVVQGPAPSPLRYLAMDVAPNGDLMVDANRPVDRSRVLSLEGMA